MVKNVKGGTGHKKQASKYTTQPSKLTVKLRLAVYEGEVYAQVTKLLGNGMCHVLCDDLKTRLCFIRGKFRGRGKRDNTLTPGKWILIGLITQLQQPKYKIFPLLKLTLNCAD